MSDANAMDIFEFTCSFLVFLSLSTTCVTMETTSMEEPLTFDRDLYTQLLRRVEHLERRDQDQEAEIDAIRGELYAEKRRTSRLEGRLARLQATLGQPGGNGEASNADDAAAVKQHVDDEASGEDAVQSSDTQGNRIRRQTGTPVVAFNAHLDDSTSHMGVHQPIVFNNVQINVGNGYNPHLGAFVAPVSGIYVFHTTVVIDGDDTEFIIMENGNAAAGFYTGKAKNGSHYSSANGMIVVHLNKGDDVTVQNYSADRTYWGYGSCIFSGFLLHQDDAASTIVG